MLTGSDKETKEICMESYREEKRKVKSFTAMSPYIGDMSKLFHAMSPIMVTPIIPMSAASLIDGDDICVFPCIRKFLATWEQFINYVWSHRDNFSSYRGFN